ncbi:hypothetical protein B0H13DRAFT_1096416 [Mycena leptocephala]|nr:hypothetical protein B0H13DRAFT_109100 [Mycena leptocephala]KAJ7863195.1 hypothetical protein B0H13DRAFT_1096416 [Mycena leptocephala]
MSQDIAILPCSVDSLLMPGAYPDEYTSPAQGPLQTLGTCSNGQIRSHVPCANISNPKSSTPKQCFKRETMACSKCYLVKYCGSECQVQHWKAHKNYCKHPYID